MSGKKLNLDAIELMDDDIAEFLRGKTTVERVAMISQANRVMRDLIAGMLRYWHSDWPEDQIKLWFSIAHGVRP